MGKVHLGALLCHMHVPLAGLRFNKEKEIARAVAFIFVIKALRLPWLCRQGLSGLFAQLLVGLIKVDLGTCGIIRLRVDVQHVLHSGDKLAVHFWNAPLLLQPRLEVAFFKTRRTLSYEYDAARPSATTRSASKCKVQCLRPSGASLQAAAIRRASAFSSSLGAVWK